MDSGKWRFNNDFKSLFASDNLATNTEVIFYRSYDDVLKVTHAVSSYSNGTEGQPRGANLDLLKAFICTDGQIWQNSTVANAKDFTLKIWQKQEIRVSKLHLWILLIRHLPRWHMHTNLQEEMH